MVFQPRRFAFCSEGKKASSSIIVITMHTESPIKMLQHKCNPLSLADPSWVLSIHSLWYLHCCLCLCSCDSMWREKSTGHWHVFWSWDRVTQYRLGKNKCWTLLYSTGHWAWSHFSSDVALMLTNLTVVIFPIFLWNKILFNLKKKNKTALLAHSKST